MSRASVALLTVLLALVPLDAHAYIDPGTGSYIFQAVAAALVTVGFLLRSYWHRIRQGLGRLFGPRRGRPTR